jgi:hypothetical protein
MSFHLESTQDPAVSSLLHCRLHNFAVAVVVNDMAGLAKHRVLSRSLSAQNGLMSGGLFGSNLRPTFPNMIQVKDMDPRFLPKASAPKHPTADNVNRLIRW